LAQNHTVDPEGILEDLRVQARLHGPEVYILHPHDIEQTFLGITLTVYQAAKRLFCTSLFRTDRTVRQILGAWAREASAAPPSAEAIWAICEYLRADRDEQFMPRIEQSTTRWYIGVIQLDVLIRSQSNVSTKPRFVCVVSDVPEHVLAFRRYGVDAPPNEVIALALYDVLISQRQPEPLVPNGLTWHVPASIVSEIPLPTDILACCAALNLPIEVAGNTPGLIHDLHSTWTRSLAGRAISVEWFEAILDNYLEKRHGYGPRKARDDADFTYRHLQGYNRDPALVAPALRYLLPMERATVSSDGTITVAERLYYDPLLASWCGRPVDVRVSRHDPSQVYVYLDGAILCQAQEVGDGADSETLDPLSDH
jgi:hypothetical protein